MMPPNDLGSLLPTILADNQIGSLNWNHPHPPIPDVPNSSYNRIGCIGDGSCFFHAIAKGLAEVYQLTYQRFHKISEGLLQRFEKSINHPYLFNPVTFLPPRYQPSDDLSLEYMIINSNLFEKSLLTFRSQFVHIFRIEFSQRLLDNEKIRELVARYFSGEIEVQASVIYETYPQLPIEDIGKYSFQAVINDLVKELRSLDAVDARYAILLSEYYNVDIYVLSDKDLKDSKTKNAILSLYYNSTVRGPRSLRPANNPWDNEPSRPAIVLIHVNGGHFEIVARVEPTKIVTSFGSAEPLIIRLYEILKEVRKAAGAL